MKNKNLLKDKSDANQVETEVILRRWQVKRLERRVAELERQNDRRYNAMMKANNLAVEYQNQVEQMRAALEAVEHIHTNRWSPSILEREQGATDADAKTELCQCDKCRMVKAALSTEQPTEKEQADG